MRKEQGPIVDYGLKRIVGTIIALLLAAGALGLLGARGNLAVGPFRSAADHQPSVISTIPSPAGTTGPSDNSRDLAGGRAPVPAKPGRPISPGAQAPHQAAPNLVQPSACARAGAGPQKPACKAD